MHYFTLPLILWDVLQSCKREGSLDASIQNDQLVANPIDELLVQHPTVSLIAFNGATAEKYFIRYLSDQLQDKKRFSLIRLPSTSPAHASMNLAKKLEAWRQILPFIK